VGKPTLVKTFLASRTARVLTAAFTRVYRVLFLGTFAFRHDPRLVAFLRTSEPALFGVWHQDFVHSIAYLSRWNRSRPSYVLASASRDGTIAAVAAETIGYRGAVRGSSARGGAAALLGLHRLVAERRCSVAVVCDGPRPPPRQMRPGLIHLARESGLPIWLVRTSFSPRWVLNRSWARFFLPPFGARTVVLADGPISVPADLDREGIEAMRGDLERRLNDLAERADALWWTWGRSPRVRRAAGR
jgi:lysophospholipid acyltransferase (LPLAT)-like uncharacterized protein